MNNRYSIPAARSSIEMEMSVLRMVRHSEECVWMPGRRTYATNNECLGTGYGQTTTDGMQQSTMSLQIVQKGWIDKCMAWPVLSYSVNANVNKYKQVVCVLTSWLATLFALSFPIEIHSLVVVSPGNACMQRTGNDWTGKSTIFRRNESRRKERANQKEVSSMFLSPVSTIDCKEYLNFMHFLASCTDDDRHLFFACKRIFEKNIFLSVEFANESFIFCTSKEWLSFSTEATCWFQMVRK